MLFRRGGRSGGGLTTDGDGCLDVQVLESDGPTDKFRDNLVPWRKYITSGHSFGSSNQILTHIKMITLAARLDRIPISQSLRPPSSPLPWPLSPPDADCPLSRSP